MLQTNLMVYWSFYHKVVFDGIKKIIIITPGVTYLNFKLDVYAAWKKWTTYDDNARYPQAIRVVGGDPLVSGRYLGSTFFLMNGWRVRPWVGSYSLSMFGNVFTEEGEDPFIPTEEPCTVSIKSEVSEIVEMVQPSVTISPQAPTVQQIVTGVENSAIIGKEDTVQQMLNFFKAYSEEGNNKIGFWTDSGKTTYIGKWVLDPNAPKKRSWSTEAY